MIALGLFAGFVVLIMIMVWATGDRRTKPRGGYPSPIATKELPKVDPGPALGATPQPVRPNEGRGAYAILNEARRAKALAMPGQGAPKGTTYHVVRLSANRELAVMLRRNNEPATDQIVMRFQAKDGIGAWRERNRLQYGRAS